MTNKKLRTPKITHQRFVIWVGYALFALIVLGVLVSTVIPMVDILFNPAANHLNVVIFLISLVAGAILPMLVAYIVGDAGTRSKNRGLHHYNGVLFGFLAYWLSLIFGVIGSELVATVRENIPSVAIAALVNAWPIVATAIIASVIAVFYHRGVAKKNSVTSYAPYQLTLLASVITTVVILPLLQVIARVEYSMYSIVSFAAIDALFVVSFVCLRKIKASRVEKIVLAVIGTTAGLISLYVTAQLLPYAYMAGSVVNIISSCISLAISLVLVAVYLRVTARDLR